MKKALTLLAGLCLATSASANLIISEIVDATESGGLPKFVELTNTGTTPIDLSNFTIGNFNNGGTTLGGGASSALSGTLNGGDSYTLSYEGSDSPGVGRFFEVYGFDPDSFDLGAFINGDDVVALFDGPATGDGTDANIVDIVGEIGVDGSGQPWEYLDSFMFRNPAVTAPNATWTASEWTIGGANVLDGAGPAGIVAATSPGIHVIIPEPSSIALFMLGVVGLLVRRR